MRVMLTVAVTALTLAGAEARAQGGFPPNSFANLRVLPKDSTPASVIGQMKGFTGALGVRCQHCHVGEEGMPLEKFDFVSDSKPAKAAARAMLKLVAEINATLDRDWPGNGKTGRVSCIMCHAGRTTPSGR